MLTKEDLLAIGSLMDEKLEAGLKPIKADITEIKDRLSNVEGRLAELVKPLEGRLGANERATKELGILVENETNRAINLLFEGHKSLKQMIEGRLVTKEQQENSEARIFALEEVSKRHTVQIEELQKKTG